MKLPDADDVRRMTGAEILEVLRQAIEAERSECARLADGLAERLTQSGKHDEAMTAMQIAASIKARE